MIDYFKKVKKCIREGFEFVDYCTFKNELDDKLNHYKTEIEDDFEKWKRLNYTDDYDKLFNDMEEGMGFKNYWLSNYALIISKRKGKDYLKLLGMRHMINKIDEVEDIEFLLFEKEGLRNFMFYQRDEQGINRALSLMKKLERVYEEEKEEDAVPRGMFI